MNIVDDLSSLDIHQIEAVEKLTMRWLFQAVIDFGIEAEEVFMNSPDEVQDIAEDITRDMLDRLPGFNVPQRIFGTVDYKRARYVILPENIIRQALFVDSKAEKENRTATLQMSQTSLQIRQLRAGIEVNERGLLPAILEYNTHQYLATTAFFHFWYDAIGAARSLREITIFCLPNAKLQELYMPGVIDAIWLAGRNAPSLGEDFRVRVSFNELKKVATWRVQKVVYNTSNNRCWGEWSD